MTHFPFSRENHEGILLEVYIQPKAAKNEITGVHEGSLKIRLTAPPVEGAANKECIKFLAKWLHVSKSAVQIVQGQKSRHKTILIRELSLQQFQKALEESGFLS